MKTFKEIGIHTIGTVIFLGLWYLFYQTLESIITIDWLLVLGTFLSALILSWLIEGLMIHYTDKNN
jgi:hypothetical protein